MTEYEKIIATGFTGFMFVSDIQPFVQEVEKRLKRLVFTHDLPSLEEEIQEAFRADFLEMVSKKE